MHGRITTGICLLTTLVMSVPVLPETMDYSRREEVRSFARELAESDGFTADGLLTVFRQAKYKQTIIDAISRPAERVLTWNEYQDIFLTKNRISAGRKFMMDNREALTAAYAKYGVPPVIVAAIIGVETMYGKHKGNYRVLDALMTLAFDYPPRSSFFRKELREFILLVREENQLVTELQGSYAGAMGYGQFIPSSYRYYAIDFDGDGVRDIWNNPTDAIGSVANYFSEHGWRKGETVVVNALLDKMEDSLVDSQFNVSLKPSSTVGAMRELGVKPLIEIDETLEVSPMKLAGKNGDEYWLGMHNFYVITRYNHSKLYAMAVFQLSEALRTAGKVASHSYH
ncbi:MAG: lytic murein transglycosylase B [Gammaproteobacteria bacterium]|jgi:membrane-bound lytic murein transglycosylase B|nr:lytic murein transglycosylase B [Gammaproteobacteria bacterium]|tara:strand:- start:84 stop:1106 length:1023 start_codon:yes stop_codon:yes gene_type:complete